MTGADEPESDNIPDAYDEINDIWDKFNNI
jgi:hypothetical protein